MPKLHASISFRGGAFSLEIAMNQTQNAATQTGTESNASHEIKLNAKLIQEVTDKVYALWHRDLQIEKERVWRIRPSSKRRI